MDDSMPVRLFQRQGYLVQKVRNQRQRGPWLALLEVRERLPVEEFHDEVWDLAPAGIGDSEIRDVDDIHMAQTATSLRFPLEARQETRVRRPLGSDHFYGHDACGSEVRGEVNVSHTTRAQLAVDAVFAVEDFLDHGGPERQTSS